jgi:phage-related protein
MNRYDTHVGIDERFGSYLDEGLEAVVQHRACWRSFLWKEPRKYSWQYPRGSHRPRNRYPVESSRE